MISFYKHFCVGLVCVAVLAVKFISRLNNLPFHCKLIMLNGFGQSDFKDLTLVFL